MFRVFISNRIKKQKGEGTKCHTKTMMSREVDKTVFILIVCLFAASFCPVMILLQPRIQKGESQEPSVIFVFFFFFSFSHGY
jgi:hypothetical protein